MRFLREAFLYLPGIFQLNCLQTKNNLATNVQFCVWLRYVTSAALSAEEKNQRNKSVKKLADLFKATTKTKSHLNSRLVHVPENKEETANSHFTALSL